MTLNEKKLNNYANNKLQLSFDKWCMTHQYIDEVKEFYNNDVPDNIIKKILNDEYPDFIYENLQTHNVNLLIKKIYKEYPFIKEFNYRNITENIKAFYMQIYTNDIYKIFESINPIKCNDKLLNLLNFFNYYVSQIRYLDNNIYLIYVEPLYSKNVSKLIFNEHYKLYHITDSLAAKNILQKGLRCKSSIYREYPQRIYLYAIKNNLKLQDENVKLFIKKILNINNLKSYGGSILRIKNDGRIFTFYQDESLPENSIFTYNNIPKNFIKEIFTFTYNDIYK